MYRGKGWIKNNLAFWHLSRQKRRRIYNLRPFTPEADLRLRLIIIRKILEIPPWRDSWGQGGIYEVYIEETPVMRYYPVNLDVLNSDCLVVGGGGVGERKVKALLECGAKVTVISLDATEHLKVLASEGHLVLKLRGYRSSDLDARFLVIGATNDEDLNQQISQDASKRGTLCNIADRPQVCTFVLPAIVRQGDLVIAISTSNRSPAVAKWIRQALEKEFGPEYAILLNVMGAIRQGFQVEKKSPEAHKGLFEQLLAKGLLEMIREDRTQDVDSLFKEVLGQGYTWEELMTIDQVS